MSPTFKKILLQLFYILLTAIISFLIAYFNSLTRIIGSDGYTIVDPSNAAEIGAALRFIQSSVIIATSTN